MIQLSKAKLENICVQCLNYKNRSRQVTRISLVRREMGERNWTLGTVEPRFGVSNARRSLGLIRELQRKFRMA
jgi:hypothetical protein